MEESGDLFDSMPERAVIVDVSARDGLQSVPGLVSPQNRAAWVKRLLAASIDEVEAGAFVDPRLIPQMADSASVFALLTPEERDRSWALIPNTQGFFRALEAGAENVICVASATESHSRHNLGRSVDAVVAGLEKTMEAALKHNIRARVALSMAWSDPDEGVVPVERTAKLCERFHSAGFREITLCDTHGAASPRNVARLIGEISPLFPPSSVGIHMHDTFGFALANVLAGLLSGVGRFDSSVNGLGGCPVVPGAGGNVDTLKLLELLKGLGVETSADPAKVAETARFCSLILKS